MEKIWKRVRLDYWVFVKQVKRPFVKPDPTPDPTPSRPRSEQDLKGFATYLVIECECKG